MFALMLFLSYRCTAFWKVDKIVHQLLDSAGVSKDFIFEICNFECKTKIVSQRSKQAAAFNLYLTL